MIMCWWTLLPREAYRQRRLGAAYGSGNVGSKEQKLGDISPFRFILQHKIVLAVGNKSVCAQTTADERAVAFSDSPFVLVLKYELGFIELFVNVIRSDKTEKFWESRTLFQKGFRRKAAFLFCEAT